MRAIRFISVPAVLLVLLVSGMFVGCTNSSVPAPETASSGNTAPSLSPLSTPIVSKSTQPAGSGDWGTIKGTVTWGERVLPTVKAFTVNKDQDHCLKGKTEILDDELIVNKDNKGVKDAVVFLMPMSVGNPLPVHPSLKEPKEKTVVIDQPHCLFEPRVVALRWDQVLEAKNSSPISHNFHYVNTLQEDNVSMAPGKSLLLDKLRPSYKKILLKCDIHGWMKGSIWVFDHPYFAVTDADGKYEIKNAPAGTYKIAFFHDANGWLNTKTFGGAPIVIPAGDSVTADAKVMKPED